LEVTDQYGGCHQAMVTADDHTTYSLARSTATSAITETILSARTLDTDAGRTVDTYHSNWTR